MHSVFLQNGIWTVGDTGPYKWETNKLPGAGKPAPGVYWVKSTYSTFPLLIQQRR